MILRKSSGLRYFCCVIISICAFIPFLFFSRPVRVGDGSEYYAMAVAWSETHRPFMGEAAWVYYEELYRANTIPGILGSQALSSYAPDLIHNKRQDFPHFWFYSLGPGVIAEIGDYSGFRIPIHDAFLILHCVLLAMLLITAMHSYGWQGMIASLVLIFLSPAFWYIDKVHTEFFTICLTTSAVILFTRQKYFSSSLFLAFAATQNISFSAISIFVLAIGVSTKPRYTWKLAQVLIALASLFVNALHPMYYLLRYGSPSPQFISGGAQIGLFLHRFWIWLLDPDIGLLPNWWLGVFLIVFVLTISFLRKWRYVWLSQWLLFIFVYLAISLLAQSSTINLNSGASPGPSRYALWYLGLFFPALLLLFRTAGKTHLGAFALTLLIFISGYTSIRNYLPSLVNMVHCQPSAASYWIQKNLSWLYNPPPEIFAERYSGKCEAATGLVSVAVIAPDCQKVIVINQQVDSPITVTGASGCRLDFDRVGKEIEEKVNSGYWSVSNEYYHLTPEQTTRNTFYPLLEVDYSLSFGATLSQAIGSDYRNWGLVEDWGVWTASESAALDLPCPKTGNLITALELDVQPFVSESHPSVSATFNIDGKEAWSGTIDNQRTLHVDLPLGTCSTHDIMDMQISIDNPISRAELLISADKRELGIGLISLRYLSQ